MWVLLLHVAVCVSATIHAYSVTPQRVCCNDLRCSFGKCMKGYCQHPYIPQNSKQCMCSPGFLCCRLETNPTTTSCEKCSNMYRCVANHRHCASPVRDTRCSCPKGTRCCKGPFCFECGGQCIYGVCARPFFQILSARCPCPRGMSCCKEAKCETLCKPSRCVPKVSICNHPVHDERCNCPLTDKCCKYSCESFPCSNICVKGLSCPVHMRPATPNCTCPSGFMCCHGKCPHQTRTLASCNRLGGWVISATGLPSGHVCCKLPTCERNCRSFKAKCAHPATCTHRLIYLQGTCYCPPDKVCCKYTCELSGCKGVCVKGPCPKGSKKLDQKTCTCPIGSSCCLLPCPYKPCVTKATCEEHRGKVIPSWECTNSSVCCKGTCECPHPPCRTLHECMSFGGTPLPSSNCINGLVCCDANTTTPPPPTTPPTTRPSTTSPPSTNPPTTRPSTTPPPPTTPPTTRPSTTPPPPTTPPTTPPSTTPPPPTTPPTTRPSTTTRPPTTTATTRPPTTTTTGVADTACFVRLGGTCQPNTLPCRGSYLLGKCDGPATRQCCIPRR
ncbi:multiple epidermal growth factor-like domains protein 6 [Lineus longissimus]|uniref:multiple epidermal growth factor-like domains protein 6 n=1 Tax=Lineus longissimus TaxID=88925 RepID=UPI00315DB8DA